MENDCVSILDDIYGAYSPFNVFTDHIVDSASSNYHIPSISLDSSPFQTVHQKESKSAIAITAMDKNTSLAASGPTSQRRRRFCDMKDANGEWIVPRIPLPRIIKRDIRRSYAQMLTNVYNSHDEELLHRFVSQMIPDNYCYRFGFDGKQYDLSSADKWMLHRFCFEHMCLSPDVVFHFSADRIKLRSDDTATLSGQFTVTGNMIFHTPYDEKLVRDEHQMSPSFRVQGNRILYVGNRASMKFHHHHHSNDNAPLQKQHPLSKDESPVDDDDSPIIVFPEDLALFPVPKTADFSMSGEFAMRLNAQAKIETIELSMHQYLLNQLPAKPLSSSKNIQNSC